MKKIAFLLIFALVIAVLSACAKNDGGAATAPESTDAGTVNPGNATEGAPSESDFGWVKLDVPDGYNAFKESEQYITIENSKNSKQFVRITRDYIMGYTLDDLSYGQISNNPGKYTKGADGYFSGFSWNVVNYEENGMECRMFFALAGDGEHYLRVTAIGLTENDFALQVIMGHLIFNMAEL